MPMAVMSEETRKVLEKRIGLPLNQVSDLGVRGEAAHVKARTGMSLQFSKIHDSRRVGRGNPLLARNRITTIEEINTKIDALIK